VAGKSLGTDLAKGKLTLPLLLAWERASAKDRIQLRRLVEQWQPASMDSLADLLARYKTLAGSLEVMAEYLSASRAAVLKLPPSAGRDGLLGLTDYLARQTESLGTATADSP
jgi:octaprenyl-diphosphate synthase